MREIKFRAWEKYLKEIIPVENINFKNKMINTGSAWRIFEEIELMQYTGLKDKNGKEIYEGDVINYQQDSPFGVLGRVVWESGGFIIQWNDDGEVSLNEFWYDPMDKEITSVIGNIYENPKLLDKFL